MTLGHEGTQQGPFLPKAPLNLNCTVHFDVYLGVQEGRGESLESLQSSTITKYNEVHGGGGLLLGMVC